MPIAYTSTSLSRIRALTSRMSIVLDVSLPSEMMRSAFLRFSPRWASGIASSTVSYIAVPPFGVMRPSARVSNWRSFVQFCSRIGRLLNRYKNI